MKEYTVITLGAVMIVKNEEKNLGGILSDIRDAVDEICIVDTGSSDGTVPLAESFGARIEYLPWSNDFSAARNHSLACAESDYLIWLDADDRIDENDREALRTLKSRLRPSKDRAYTLKILGRSNDMPDTVSCQTRIIPNRIDIRFEGRVHEQILPSLEKHAISVEPVNITIRHTGYHNHDARIAKAHRNLTILTEELHAGKDTANQHFFMAMACIDMKDYQQCLEYLSRARHKRTDEDWLHFSYTISTDCLLRLERIEDARTEITKGTDIFRNSPLLHYYLGRVCMKAGRFTEAVAALEKAAALPQKIDSYPTPPDLRTTILLQLGRALERAERLGDAIETYTRALKSGTQQKSLHHAKGIALLQDGKIDDALLHLGKARDLSARVDIALWQSLAQIYLFRKAHDQAHALYLDILRDAPEHLGALAGALGTSIELDDIDAFLNALEKLLLILDIPVPEAEIESLAECAVLCIEAANRLKKNGERALAHRLAETALLLDMSSSGAHLLLADLSSEEGDTSRMLESLEAALKSGAESEEIIKRIDAAKHSDISRS